MPGAVVARGIIAWSRDVFNELAQNEFVNLESSIDLEFMATSLHQAGEVDRSVIRSPISSDTFISSRAIVYFCHNGVLRGREGAGKQRKRY